MPVLGKIIGSADVEAGALTPADDVRRLVKRLHAEVELLGDLAPDGCSKEPVVLVADTRIDPVAAANIDGPRAEFLLQPEWQENLGMAGAEAQLLIADRHFNKRKYRDLRKPVVFVG